MRFKTWPRWFRGLIAGYGVLAVLAAAGTGLWLGLRNPGAEPPPSTAPAGPSTAVRTEPVGGSSATRSVSTAAYSTTTGSPTGSASRPATAATRDSAASTASATAEKSGTATLFDGPGGMASSRMVSLEVNGRSCFVYEVNVNTRRQSPGGNAADVLRLEKAPVAVWETAGSNTVSVTLADGEVGAPAVTPRSLAITPRVQGRTVTFTIPGPGQYTLEWGGFARKAMHLFVGTPHAAPAAGSGALVYGPGVHEVGQVNLSSGQTVYIAGGAVVRGWFVAQNASDIRMYGSGIVDGSLYPRYRDDGVSSAAHPPIQFSGCTNMQLEGVTFLDPSGWAVNTYHCTSVRVDRVNIVTSRQNGDGITTQSCRDQTVTNCFVRSWDDSLVVKAYEGDVQNIVFRDCILWTDLAQSCEVGYETRGDRMDGILFENITVLHNFHKAVLSIHNGDHAAVTNVTFRGIVVEDAQMGQGDGSNLLFDIRVADTIWSKEDQRGSVKGVRFENVSVLSGKKPGGRLEGFDEVHAVSDVSFRQIRVLGMPVTSLSAGGITTNAFVQSVRFE